MNFNYRHHGSVASTIIALIISLVLVVGLSFGFVSLLVWGICTLALKIGFTHIFGWTICFSWSLSLLVYLIGILIGCFVNKGGKS